MGKTKYDWEEVSKDFGTLMDREISEKWGISRKVIASKRITLGIPNVSKRTKYKDIIGELPDKEAARIMGVTPNAVTRLRLRMGVGHFTNMSHDESSFRDYISSLYGGWIEFPIGHFRADVVAQNKIIECKVCLTDQSLKVAIGQLMLYSWGMKYYLGIEGYELAIAYNITGSHSRYSQETELLVQANGIKFLHFPDWSPDEIITNVR